MTTAWRTELDSTRHTLYVKAERWWWAAFALVAIGVSASLFLIPPSASSRGAWMALLMMANTCAPVLAAMARYRSAQLAGRGDMCRRAALYKDSLGESVPIADRQILALWPSGIPLEKVTTSEPYFAASEPQGCVRLARNIAESAFYSRQLSSVVGTAGLLICGALVVATLAAASSATYFPLDPRAFETMQSGISAIATVLLVLLLGEIFLMSLAYRGLASGCEQVFRAASQLAASSECTLPKVLRISEEYSIALAANLPLPNFLYKLLRTKIEDAFKQQSAASP